MSTDKKTPSAVWAEQESSKEMQPFYKTLADVQPGGRVRLATVPYDRARDLIGDAYNAGTHGIGYSQQAMELHDAIIPAQPSPGGQGDVLVTDEMVQAACKVWAETPGQGEDWMRTALQAALAARQPVGEPVEMSPEFTDTARAAIAWVLWHHRGGSSPVGQPLRFALGMGQHDRMTDHQIAEAKRFAAWANATTEDFHQRAPAQAVDLAENMLSVLIEEGVLARNGRVFKKLRAMIDSQAVGNGN